MGRRPIGKQAMTAAERQRKRRQHLRKQIVTAPVTEGDWREGKTPEEIAELDDLARQYHEADERCTSAIDMELQELREIAEVAAELIELLHDHDAALKRALG
jgi:hypothetical protein